MKNILIGYDLHLHSEFDLMLSELGKSFQCVTKNYDGQWLMENISSFDVIIPNLAVPITDVLLEQARGLKLIFTPTTGVDHLCFDVKKFDVCVKSLLDFKEELSSVSSSAEHAFLLMLSLARKLPSACNDVIGNDRWDRNQFVGEEISGKILGIVGLGRIGTKVAEYATAFGMSVRYFDIKKVSENYQYVDDIKDLVRGSDYVLISVTYDETAHHLIDESVLKCFDSETCLVNISRGGIIDEKALCDCLKDGAIGGVAVDVVENELNDPLQSPLVVLAKERDDIIITPHIGGATFDAWKKVFELVFHEIINDTDVIGEKE